MGPVGETDPEEATYSEGAVEWPQETKEERGLWLEKVGETLCVHCDPGHYPLLNACVDVYVEEKSERRAREKEREREKGG